MRPLPLCVPAPEEVVRVGSHLFEQLLALGIVEPHVTPGRVQKESHCHLVALSSVEQYHDFIEIREPRAPIDDAGG